MAVSWVRATTNSEFLITRSDQGRFALNVHNLGNLTFDRKTNNLNGDNHAGDRTEEILVKTFELYLEGNRTAVAVLFEESGTRVLLKPADEIKAVLRLAVQFGNPRETGLVIEIRMSQLSAQGNQGFYENDYGVTAPGIKEFIEAVWRNRTGNQAAVNPPYVSYSIDLDDGFDKEAVDTGGATGMRRDSSTHAELQARMSFTLLEGLKWPNQRGRIEELVFGRRTVSGVDFYRIELDVNRSGDLIPPHVAEQFELQIPLGAGVARYPFWRAGAVLSGAYERRIGDAIKDAASRAVIDAYVTEWLKTSPANDAALNLAVKKRKDGGSDFRVAGTSTAPEGEDEGMPPDPDKQDPADSSLVFGVF